jgi:hypothetical protein
VESLLSARHKACWHCVLGVVQSLFNRLHADSYPLLQGMLKLLVSLVLRHKSLPARTQEALDAALGAAIFNMGPERILASVPLFADMSAPSLAPGNNVWLLPVLKKHVRGARLDYFTQVRLMGVHHWPASPRLVLACIDRTPPVRSTTSRRCGRQGTRDPRHRQARRRSRA